MGAKINLPFTYQDFFTQVTRTVAEHNGLLKENNALAKFWKIVEYCFTRNLINYDPVERKYVSRDYDISWKDNLRLKRGNEIVEHSLGKSKQVLVIRFNLVYGAFSKVWREQHGTQAPTEGTILKYLQDQSYYIGLVPGYHYHDTNTSGFAFDYDVLNQEIVLEPNSSVYKPPDTENTQKDEKTTEDTATPF